jgi:hypothetical protein
MKFRRRVPMRAARSAGRRLRRCRASQSYMPDIAARLDTTRPSFRSDLAMTASITPAAPKSLDDIPGPKGVPVLGLVGEARQRGKPVHMGRVNTRQRWRYADYLGLWANTRAGAASYEVVTRVTAVRSAATPATDVPDGDLSPWCSHPRSFAPGPDAARCRSSHQQCATTRRQRGAALDATGPA